MLIRSKGKGILIFFIFFTFLVSNLCFALDESSSENIGSTKWFYYQDKVPLVERLSISTLTVVGGALCSTDPDWSNEGVITGTQICWTNNNHPGDVYQIWQTTQGGKDVWIRLHPLDYVNGHGLKIAKGEKKCLSVTSGEAYYRQVFYCTNLVKSCSNYQPICRTDSTTKFQRTCSDTGIEYITEKWIEDFSLPYCSGFVPPTSGGSSNPVGPPIDPPLPSLQLRGSWSDIAVPNNVGPGEEIKVSGTFTADVKGKYLLEAGIPKTHSPLSVAGVTLPKGSKCDGDLHWSGDYLELDAGEKINVQFSFDGREEEGMYSVVFGAYSGCLDDGGKDVSVYSQALQIKDFGGLGLGNNTVGLAKYTSFIFVALVVFGLGGLYYFRKK